MEKRVLGLFLLILAVSMTGSVIAWSCTKEGGTGSLYQSDSCCATTVQISNKQGEYPNCTTVDKEHFICAKCGNGECGPGENSCNCMIDCKKTTSGCEKFYWFDNTDKNCSQKDFCGAYMYYGLKTFKSKEECENAAEIIKPCPDVTAPTKDYCPGGYTIHFYDEDNCTIWKCMFNLSNGRKAEVKIMPGTASTKAIAKLGDLGFTIELKEVGKGTNAKVVYELTGKKQGKFLGIFKIMASEKVQVDVETGEVKKVIKPWWSFLASGI